jgi:hypothetical protein
VTSTPFELLVIASLYLYRDDVQGGYPNGQVNGLKHSLLTNGRIPNGQMSRDRCAVRIIENPQVMFSCYEGDCIVIVAMLYVGSDFSSDYKSIRLMVL